MFQEPLGDAQGEGMNTDPEAASVSTRGPNEGPVGDGCGPALGEDIGDGKANVPESEATKSSKEG